MAPPPYRRRQAGRFVAATTVAALAAVGCSSSPDDASDPTSTVPSTTSSTAPGDPGESTTTTAGDTTTTAPTTTAAPDPGDVDLALEQVATVDGPIAMAPRPGTDELLVAERGGAVRRLTPDGSGGYDVDPAPVVEVAVTTEGEGGLLGIELSADGEVLYLSFTDPDGNTVIGEVDADGGDVATILTVEQPYSNHNGGDIHLGPDGYLYVALGDGGSAGDPLGSGQDPSTLLGALLRIDPAGGGGDAYAVPDDNPFADGSAGAPEVWAYGLRNPWRFSFDADTGDLWIGDVGQGAVEEIDRLTAADGGGAGANLGWSEMEGSVPYEGGTEPADHVGPVYEYGHDRGCSVTGGYVYRGDAIPALEGTYVYGDFCEATIHGLTVGDGEPVDVDLGLALEPGSLVSFGEDADGELYALSITDGGINRIVAAA